MRRIGAGLAMLALCGALMACGPEATRARSGGPGADPGNHATLPPERQDQSGVHPIVPVTRTAQPVR